MTSWCEPKDMRRGEHWACPVGECLLAGKIHGGPLICFSFPFFYFFPMYLIVLGFYHVFRPGSWLVSTVIALRSLDLDEVISRVQYRSGGIDACTQYILLAWLRLPSSSSLAIWRKVPPSKTLFTPVPSAQIVSEARRQGVLPSTYAGGFYKTRQEVGDICVGCLGWLSVSRGQCPDISVKRTCLYFRMYVQISAFQRLLWQNNEEMKG